MAILSTLLSIAKPSGMWESIIWGFESFTNNYVWAIILLTIIIRLIWSPLDTYNRHISMKNAKIQAIMKPELDKVQQKYGNDKQLLNQKTNEIYKKHKFNMMGSCGFMLVFMVLNLVVFFTLFSSLNKIATYKIYENYDNLKEKYANCLNVADINAQKYVEYFNANKGDDKEPADIAELLEFRIFTDGEGEEAKTYVALFEKTEELTSKETAWENSLQEYLTLEQFKERDEQPEDFVPEEGEEYKKLANNEINKIIVRLKNQALITEQVPNEEEEGESEVVTYNLLDAITQSTMPLIRDEYKLTQEKFLWIQNIWIADSPFKKSMVDFSGFKGMVGLANIEEDEEQIYNSFMPVLSQFESKTNGYLILPLLCVLVTLASSYMTTLLSRKKKNKDEKSAQKEAPVPGQGKVMQIVMAVLMGMFALFYNAVFAIYMFVSQAISAALIPLQQLIVTKIDGNHEKKLEQQKSKEVDYRRK